MKCVGLTLLLPGATHVASIVDAVASSTRAYLGFLNNPNKQKPAGVTRHKATEVSLHEDGDSFLEDEVWKTYRCRLPSHQSVLSDYCATMTSDALPAKEVEIRILEYDRRSGLTKFAARTEITGQTGYILIDFRWLVKRCLEWFEVNGTAVAEIDQIPTPASISCDSPVNAEGLSDVQREAIKTVLTAKLSYIWGVPGTGKTQWILAKAVRHCVDENRKVLVLASTNLAVDNALVAILNAGVERDKVARVGIPSEDFVHRFHDCCEARAFHREIRQIRSQIKVREDSIASVERERCLARRLGENEGQINSIHATLAERDTTLGEINEGLQDILMSISGDEERRNSLETQWLAKQHEADSLSFPDLDAHVKTLESEQIETITHIKRLEKEVQDMGFFSRVFTKRQHELTQLIQSHRSHLQSVEATLETKRSRREELIPIVRQLQEEITALALSRDEMQKEIAVLRNRYRDLATVQEDLANSISGLQQDLHRAEGQREEIIAELEHLHTLPCVGLTDEIVQEWRSEIEELEAQLLHFKQDFSQKSVLGMTLDGFIGFTLQRGVNIDHVFVDEAPYAPLAKIVPLLRLRCPIAMLGDHFQLPPVCECENDSAIRAFWAKPAIFLEDAFRPGMMPRDLCALEEPQFEITQKCILTDSYRFGRSIATLLDRHVYGGIGLRGLARDKTFIECINCVPASVETANKRENVAEATRIVEYINALLKRDAEPASVPTIGILTPYINQARLIRNMIKLASWDSGVRDRIDVLNVHKAQGREWDWILFSVVDTGRLRRNRPFFADSAHPQGRPVLNTAISRAKHHLVIFLDAEYWKRRTPPSLLVELARSQE